MERSPASLVQNALRSTGLVPHRAVSMGVGRWRVEIKPEAVSFIPSTMVLLSSRRSMNRTPLATSSSTGEPPPISWARWPPHWEALTAAPLQRPLLAVSAVLWPLGVP